MKRLPISNKKLGQVRRWCEPPYENLRIVIELESPVVADPWLCLDGVLQSQVLHRIKIDLMDLDHSDVYDIPVPIEIVGRAKQYPACSIAVIGGQRHSTIWAKIWHSAVNLDAHVDQYGSEIRYRMPMRYHDSLTAVAFCRGRGDTIERLLNHAHAIGKKRSQGYGRIKKTRIELVKEDYGVIANGIAMRPIPVEELDAYDTDHASIAGYRPPYWHAQNQCLCALPGGPASLRMGD